MIKTLHPLINCVSSLPRRLPHRLHRLRPAPKLQIPQLELQPLLSAYHPATALAVLLPPFPQICINLSHCVHEAAPRVRAREKGLRADEAAECEVRRGRRVARVDGQAAAQGVRLQVRAQMVVGVGSVGGGDKGECEAALVEEEHGVDEARGWGGGGKGGAGVWEVEHGGDEGGTEMRVDGVEVRESVPMGEFEDGEVDIRGGDEVDIYKKEGLERVDRGERGKKAEGFTDRFRED